MFTNGVLPTTAAQGEALRVAVESVLTAHDNWDSVESGVVVGTVNWNVWKNRGSGLGANDLGQDFYIALGRDNTGGQTIFQIAAMESYLPATDQLIRPVAGWGQSAPMQSNNSYGDNTLGVPFSDSQVQKPYIVVSNGSSTLSYQIIVTRNGVFIAGGAGSTPSTGNRYFLYAGLFDTKLDGVSPHLTEIFPLCLLSHAGTGLLLTGAQTWGATSRHPGRTTTAVYNFGLDISNYTLLYGAFNAIDLLQGESSAPRLALMGRASNHDVYGGLRGLAKEIKLTGTSTSGGTVTPGFGDTITIDGDVYYYFQMGSISSWASWVRRDAP